MTENVAMESVFSFLLSIGRPDSENRPMCAAEYKRN